MNVINIKKACNHSFACLNLVTTRLTSRDWFTPNEREPPVNLSSVVEILAVFKVKRTRAKSSISNNYVLFPNLRNGNAELIMWGLRLVIFSIRGGVCISNPSLCVSVHFSCLFLIYHFMLNLVFCQNPLCQEASRNEYVFLLWLC